MAAGHLARRLRRPRVISRQPKLFRRITAVPCRIGDYIPAAQTGSMEMLMPRSRFRLLLPALALALGVALVRGFASAVAVAQTIGCSAVMRPSLAVSSMPLARGTSRTWPF